MDISFISRHMAHNAARIKALVEGVSSEEAQWKHDPDEWSILEIVNHLYDEERGDFRVRLNIILHHPEQDWPPIDPEGWVTERKYNEQDLTESLDKFLNEREKSLDWLHSLNTPNWETIYTAPFGSMRAGDMLSSWLTHDHLHMRQLIESHRFLSEANVVPFSMDYAGAW